MKLVLWVAFMVALVASWSLTVMMWGFAISSQGFPKERFFAAPIVMGLSAVAGIVLYYFDRPGLAAAFIILIGPLLAFLVTLISL